MRCAFICLLFLAAVIGCGRLPDEPERVVVSGTVIYQGQSVRKGRIRFIPIEDTQGPVSGGPIQEGSYRVDHKGGVPVGIHRVHIEAYRNPTPQEVDPIEGEMAVQYLPRKYNAESDLRLTVPAGSGPIVESFRLGE